MQSYMFDGSSKPVTFTFAVELTLVQYELTHVTIGSSKQIKLIQSGSSYAIIISRFRRASLGFPGLSFCQCLPNSVGFESREPKREQVMQDKTNVDLSAPFATEVRGLDAKPCSCVDQQPQDGRLEKSENTLTIAFA